MPGPWQKREKKLDGKIVRWKERDLGNGLVERVYEDEQIRTSTSQPVAVRTA